MRKTGIMRDNAVMSANEAMMQIPVTRLAAGALALALLTACGYKGPLYLPEPTEVSPAPPGTVTQPAASEAPMDDVPEAAPRIQ